jgi:hypothetical protein
MLSLSEWGAGSNRTGQGTVAGVRGQRSGDRGAKRNIPGYATMVFVNNNSIFRSTVIRPARPRAKSPSLPVLRRDARVVPDNNAFTTREFLLVIEKSIFRSTLLPHKRRIAQTATAATLGESMQ